MQVTMPTHAMLVHKLFTNEWQKYGGYICWPQMEEKDSVHF